MDISIPLGLADITDLQFFAKITGKVQPVSGDYANLWMYSWKEQYYDYAQNLYVDTPAGRVGHFTSASDFSQPATEVNNSELQFSGTDGPLVEMRLSRFYDICSFFTFQMPASTTDYRNTVATNVGARTINEADNASGIYNETASSPTRNVQKLYLASNTQVGTVGLNVQYMGRGTKIFSSRAAEYVSGNVEFSPITFQTAPSYAYVICAGLTTAGGGGTYPYTTTTPFGFANGCTCTVYRQSYAPSFGSPAFPLSEGGYTIVGGASGVGGSFYAGDALWGNGYQTGTKFGVLRSTVSGSTKYDGIDRDFAATELPKVIGGCVIGYATNTAFTDLQSSVSTLEGYFASAVGSGAAGGIFVTNGVVTGVSTATSGAGAVSGTAGGTYTSTEQTIINDLVTLVNQLRSALVSRNIVS